MFCEFACTYTNRRIKPAVVVRKLNGAVLLLNCGFFAMSCRLVTKPFLHPWRSPNVSFKFNTYSSMFGSQTQVWSNVRQHSLDEAASKSSVRLTPFQMLWAGRFKDGTHLLKSAQFLHKELPIRIARRVVDFQQLPHILLCNPVIHDVYELYLRAFSVLNKFPKVETLELEERYSRIIKQLLDDHQSVVTHLAEGFNECQKNVPVSWEAKKPCFIWIVLKIYETINAFLNRTLTSRLGIRMLAEHHLALSIDKPNYIGIVCTALNFRQIIERTADFARKVCEHTYGVAPGLIINGHTHAVFPYIAAPLEYILQELLKNAMRASVEQHCDKRSEVPNIVVTLCSNDTEFFVRISDRGGGIPESKLQDIFKYSFTTMGDRSTIRPSDSDNILFDICKGNVNNSPSGGPMAGWGFGLPTSRAYATYLGGSLQLQSMEGLGTDVYLRLRHIDGKKESFRI